ncbi:replication initiation protein RepM [Acinetobacter sp. ME22]|uniref:replication initiation protein RepM n=1 Tax=Acinetobacter sp. ME22 TaxID=2904802 RepID=UPI001EDBBBFC|nr:replication initiation protein RepM [Acinetobacter sp. ME22]MCG2575282.1 replication initiation protein RepM [Acinetobacter sp. ME22]
MSKELVVKTNRLNQAFQTLSLSELHIVQLAIVDARETGTGLSTDTPLRIDALRYAEVFNTTRQNAYMRMKEAEETLFNRRFSFFDEHGKLVKSRWIQQVRYLDDDGAIEIVFTLAVVQGISKIDGVKEFFTQYLLSQTAQLNSVYSARIYELLIQWRSTGETPIFELDTFREQLGIGINEYQRMDHFKSRVLESAIKEINEKTDITIKYKQHKKGRSISGFSFTFKQKKSAAKPTKNVEITLEERALKMTIAQRHFFANKLCRLPELGKLSQGTEGFEQFAVRIAEQLSDPVKLKAYLPYLEQVGFTA